MARMHILVKHLNLIRQYCAALPDKRRGRNIKYTMADIGMAAFAVFFTQCSSFLAFQRTLQKRFARSNAQTLFDLERIPTDNHIRTMLDGVPSDHFDAVYLSLLADTLDQGGLSIMQRLDRHTLIALDGTEYHHSKCINCPKCSTRRMGKDGDKQTHYFHSMLGATMVAPKHATVLPLPPEFMSNQDGIDKQDCEVRAAYRWIDRIGPQITGLRPVYLGDALYARQPMCEKIHALGADFLFVAKPGALKTLYEYVWGSCPEEVTSKKGVGPKRREFRYQWLHNLPIRDGQAALHVNWLRVTITNPRTGTSKKWEFVTSLPVSKGNVADLAACGRARWKIENETFNTLKNFGYNLGHNFGHGTSTLSEVLVILNLLAFTLHAICDMLDELWKRARRAAGTRKMMFSTIAILTRHMLFACWQALLLEIAGEHPP